MTTALRSRTVTCIRCTATIEAEISKPGERYRDAARKRGWRFQRRGKVWTCPECQKRQGR